MPGQTLLYLSSRQDWLVEGVEGSIDASGEVAFQRTPDLASAASLLEPVLDIGAGFGVVNHADEHGGVERLVQAPVASAIEPMPGGVARGGGDGD